MKKVAVFIKNYSIGKSSPVLCLLEFLSNHWDVDVFIQNVRHCKARVLDRETVHVIKLFKFNYLSKLIYGKERYRHIIAFDPHGFVLAKEIFPKRKPIYYSLELYFRTNHFNLIYPEKIMTKEHCQINDICGLIIQSRERELLFRKEYSLSDTIKTFFLPVTYNGPSVREKSDYYRQKYSVPGNAAIVLHLGGIQEWFSCIELAKTLAGNGKFFLIFHGYSFGDYKTQLRNTIADEGIENVVIDEKVYDDIEEIEKPLKACDIGIAWYNDHGPNFTAIGRSSGKLSAYLKYGLPVVVNYYDSTYEAIEKNGCGCCVTSFNGIKNALETIIADYAQFSANARKVYDRCYRFDNYTSSLCSFLERNSQTP